MWPAVPYPPVVALPDWPAPAMAQRPVVAQRRARHRDWHWRGLTMRPEAGAAVALGCSRVRAPRGPVWVQLAAVPGIAAPDIAAAANTAAAPDIAAGRDIGRAAVAPGTHWARLPAAAAANR